MVKRETQKISRLMCNRCGFVFTHETGIDECPYDGTSLKEMAFDPLLGEILDNKYEISSQIGSGGMSLVYKAKHLPTGRIVAIKTLQAYLRSDEMTVLRFQQEILAMSSLQHTNIVSILDHGVTPENQPYLVMDYVPGRPLSRLIKDKGRLDWRSALPVFIQVCDALHAAHITGIVHRDIKPGNIMVVQQGLAPMLARVVDFGIAKLMYGGGQRLTRTGEVIGSPLYMSPEQCTGDTLDHRADIYALGCVMHETLTGRAPLMGVNTADMMQMALFTPAPTLSVSRPDIEFPEELEQIISKMLAKNREERFDSLLAVREQLHSLAMKGGVYAPAVATIESPSKIRRGPGLLVEVGMGVLVLILFATAIITWGLPMMDSNQFNTMFIVGCQQFKDGDYELARRSFDDAQSLAENVHDRGRTECRVLSYLVNTYEHLGQTDRAQRTDEEIARIIKTQITDDDEVDKLAMAALGAAEESTRSAAEQEKLLEEINYAISVCMAKNRPQIVEKLAPKGEQIARNLKSLEVPANRLFYRLGEAYLAEDNMQQAAQAFNKAIEVPQGCTDDDLKRQSGCLAVRAARAFASRANEKSARNFYTKAMLLAADDRRTAPVTMREYADFLKKIGDNAGSEKLMEEANRQRYGERKVIR